MFVNNISPVFFEIGPIQLRWYSIPYLIGFFLTWWVLNKASDRGELPVDRKAVENFIMYSLFAVIIGARLFSVFVWDPGYYLARPELILQVWRGGLSFHGGLVGLVVAGLIWCKKYKVNFAKFSDLVVLPCTLGLALGRVGNFFNHELYGPVTDVSWCVQFEDVVGCRHPTQLYGAFGRAMLFFLLLWVNFKKKFKPGFLTWLFVFFIGLGRFLIDFIREDARYFGLSTGQYLSFLMILVSCVGLWYYYRHDVLNLIRGVIKQKR